MIPRIALLCLLVCASALAQIGAATGSIRGAIQDPSGSGVSGASVKARNVDTGFERAAASSKEGEFELPLLLPGRYEVTVSAAGFAPFKQTGVVVQLTKASALDVRLNV